MVIEGKDKSDVAKLREEWLEKGYELINIASLCEIKLGCSGWCNEFDEPDESCHHVQIWYRNENIAVVGTKGGYVIDTEKYLWFNSGTDSEDNDFVIFRKVKNENNA